MEVYKWHVPRITERNPSRPFIYKVPFEMEFLDKDYQCFRLNPDTLKLEFVYQAYKLIGVDNPQQCEKQIYNQKQLINGSIKRRA